MSTAGLERLVRTRAGLDPAALGSAAFTAAITTRMQALALDSPAKYQDLLSRDAAEFDRLLDALVVPESWFFRGGRALFDHLARFLTRTAEQENRTARALCIPCGIGEEPYSLAIALDDLGTPVKSVAIEAWDVSPAHIARATGATYSAFSFREMEAGVRERAFEPGPRGEWQLRPSLRTRVRFGLCNLANDGARRDVEPFDLVICRNVFIYLTDEGRQQGVANLERWLAPKGWLCVSHAEADRLPRGHFVAIGPDRSLVYQRRDEAKPIRKATPPRRTKPTPALPVAAPVVEAKPAVPRDSLASIRALADRGDLDAALAACNRYLAENPPSAEGFGLLGVIHLARGNTTAAVEAFTKALYLQPDHAESLEHLALVSDQRGDRARAANLRRRLQRARGGNP